MADVPPFEHEIPGLAESAAIAVQALQKQGWIIEELEWQSEEERILRFAARKGEKAVHVRCREADLAGRLMVLFGPVF